MLCSHGSAQDAHGNADEAQGTADEAQGAADEVQGGADEFPGTADEDPGSADGVQGAADGVQGSADEDRSSADESQGTTGDRTAPLSGAHRRPETGWSTGCHDRDPADAGRGRRDDGAVRTVQGPGGTDEAPNAGNEARDVCDWTREVSSEVDSLPPTRQARDMPGGHVPFASLGLPVYGSTRIAVRIASGARLIRCRIASRSDAPSSGEAASISARWPRSQTWRGLFCSCAIHAASR